MSDALLVTGGCGFIGSALVCHLLDATDHRIVTVDALTYAGDPRNLGPARSHPRHTLVESDIADTEAMHAVFEAHQPAGVLHLAAESHVDRSIDGPAPFVTTNVQGTVSLLEAALVHYESLDAEAQTRFRFVHISTDEVFGQLGDAGRFQPDSPYAPRSPYAASKAASDHFVRAWHHTYGLPTLITNGSNTYGPRQYPEKLIPVVLRSALNGDPIPVYGDGSNVRDWIYVDDHARALHRAYTHGTPGETYLVGGGRELRNIELVHMLCGLLDTEHPRSGDGSYADLITFVDDRAGHDYRYALDASATRDALDWQPTTNFHTGLQETVQWYLDHPERLEPEPHPA